MLWPAGAGGAPSRSRARAPVEGRGSLPRTPTTPSIRVLGVGAEARGAASRGAGVLDSLPGAVRWAGSLCDSPPSCAPAVRLWGAVGSGLGLGPHADRWGCAVFLPPPRGGSPCGSWGTGNRSAVPGWGPGRCSPERSPSCAQARRGYLGRDRSLSLGPAAQVETRTRDPALHPRKGCGPRDGKGSRGGVSSPSALAPRAVDVITSESDNSNSRLVGSRLVRARVDSLRS